ncbi:hypothetical protein EJB05_03831, partial [Eragrostis curvula]
MAAFDAAAAPAPRHRCCPRPRTSDACSTPPPSRRGVGHIGCARCGADGRHSPALYVAAEAGGEELVRILLPLYDFEGATVCSRLDLDTLHVAAKQGRNGEGGTGARPAPERRRGRGRGRACGGSAAGRGGARAEWEGTRKKKDMHSHDGFAHGSDPILRCELQESKNGCSTRFTMPRVGDPNASLDRVGLELGYLACIAAGCYLNGANYFSMRENGASYLGHALLQVGVFFMGCSSMYLALDTINSSYARPRRRN